MAAANSGRAATRKGLQIFARAIPYGLRHPRQLITMFICMLGSQSWNWQLRGPNPPTQLVRQTVGL